MNVVITLAGHSRRFKAAGYAEPKFLIQIDGKSMLEHVIDMFDAKDSFHFVLNESQIAVDPTLKIWLSSLTKRSHVHVIPVHELGPVYSALSVKGIPNDSQTIITYCDFIVNWNYQQFVRQISGFDAAIPAFRGFHPASFGNTYYAYMRVDSDLNLLELREKQSFTDTRHEEFASAGIYYFSKWSIFRKYAEQLMQEGFQGINEGYVSLLANLMVADEITVRVSEVERFICWGTPEDLEQYMFWSNYFRKNKCKSARKIEGKAGVRQVNLIPMAGLGSRFKDAGYKVSKPLINVGQQPMVVAACSSFPEANQWVFLLRREDVVKHPIMEALRRYFTENSIIIQVDHDTSGQAATCLLAQKVLRDDDHLLIASCDYKTIYDNAAWDKLVEDESIDAVIWTYRLGANMTKNYKAFAYCVTANDDTEVKRIVEKNTISESPGKDALVVGTFWFRRAKDFISSAEQAISQDLQVNGEHYVANSMNLLLKEGKKIVIFDIDQWVSFGDPFELDIYYYWDNFFYDFNKKLRKTVI